MGKMQMHGKIASKPKVWGFAGFLLTLFITYSMCVYLMLERVETWKNNGREADCWKALGEKMLVRYDRRDPAQERVLLYRILGNDLPGRHTLNQTLTNIHHILHHEPVLEGCQKRFVVNRITNAAYESEIIAALEEHGMHYLRIPFVAEEYKQIPLDISCFSDPTYFLQRSYYMDKHDMRMRAILTLYRKKNLYAMNNNGARNAALTEGKTLATWTLPWDGNCFLENDAWSYLHQNMSLQEEKYLTVPMIRLDTFSLQQVGTRLAWNVSEEPQVAFHWTSEHSFNEAYQYGNLPKVELLQRLGTPGQWSRWNGDASLLKLRCFGSGNASSRRPAERLDRSAGWVFRLPSGFDQQETGSGARILRYQSRQAGILRFLMDLDMEMQHHKFSDTIFIDQEVLEQERLFLQHGQNGSLQTRVEELLQEAREALGRGPFSVMNKRLTAPSGDKHDYFHCSPYMWPYTDGRNQTFFQRKDGQRHPAAEMYSEESADYDRTSLQRVFDDATATALAWYFTGDISFARHGAELVRVFFLDDQTKMNPHMQYAQYSGRESKSGIIEMKDLYFFLDAVRLLQQAGAFSKGDAVRFKSWLEQYVTWLQTSELGLAVMLSENNHGIYYDLQISAIASFLEDRLLLAEALARSLSRLPFHFLPDGTQPHELVRPTSKHYCTFNLMGWVHMAILSSKFGSSLWKHESANGASISGALMTLLGQANHWPYPNRGGFDEDRFKVLYWITNVGGKQRFRHLQKEQIYDVKSKFHPHDGIRSFWNIGLQPECC